jgi:hypothetical protein
MERSVLRMVGLGMVPYSLLRSFDRPARTSSGGRQRRMSLCGQLCGPALMRLSLSEHSL